jgi:long-chain acyl-CoA synthetase
LEKFWLKLYPKGIQHEIDIKRYSCIGDIFDEACGRFSKMDSFTNMGIKITYSELDSLSSHFAGFFLNHWKLKKGDAIAIQMPNLLQYPVVLFGALRAGLVVVNVNPLYTPREMQYQLKDSGAKAIVILANFASKLQQVQGSTQIENVLITELGDLFPTAKRIITNFVVKFIKRMVPHYNIKHTTFRAVLALPQMTFKKPNMNLQDTAFYQYTGGTTGVSKGAILTHKNIVANLEQISEWMKPTLKDGEEVIITALPLYHIFSLTVNCLGLFKRGMTNVLITNPRDIKSLIKEINKSDPTLMTVVSTLLGAIMESPHFKSLKIPRLKVSVAGGMALKGAVATKWKEKTGTVVIEGYGLTEASPVVSCNPLDDANKLGTIGMPLPSTEIKIIDEEGKEVAVGKEGELCCRGPQVMKGYLNHEDETKLVLQPDGWLKTGDMALMQENGYMRIVDRKKDMILVSGFNVYPTEIEEVMMHHPGIAEVAAIGVPDEHSGELVKLFVVPRDSSLTKEDVLQYAKKELTGYKRPKDVEFRKELPKTNVGKILRRALRPEEAT